MNNLKNRFNKGHEYRKRKFEKIIIDYFLYKRKFLRALGKLSLLMSSVRCLPIV